MAWQYEKIITISLYCLQENMSMMKEHHTGQLIIWKMDRLCKLLCTKNNVTKDTYLAGDPTILGNSIHQTAEILALQCSFQ